MHITSLTGVALLPLAIALGGCSGSSSQSATTTSTKPAHDLIVVDVSASPATISVPAVAKAARNRIGESMQRDMALGDTLTVYQAGSANAERMVGFPAIVTGYGLRIPAARKKLEAQLQQIAQGFEAQGGDASTHLTETLEAIHPDCSSGRDTITLVTDGVQVSAGYSAASALAVGKPVSLPSPPGRYLAGCKKLVMLGFGLTIDPSGDGAVLLPSTSLAALRQGWLTYLTQAGMRPQDVEFVSAF